jgi:hypothetical protein
MMFYGVKTKAYASKIVNVQLTHYKLVILALFESLPVINKKYHPAFSSEIENFFIEIYTGKSVAF